MSVNECLAFPRCLFGSTQATRSAWREIAEAGWQAGSFEGIFSSLKMVPVHAYAGPIVVWNDKRRLESDCRPIQFVTQSSMWQVNWLLEEHPAPYDEMLDNGMRHFRLILSGLNYAWFAMGLLQGDRRHLPFLHGMLVGREIASIEVQRTVLRPFARAFTRWLGTMELLSDRIAIASGRKAIDVVGLASRIGLFVDIAYHCGCISEEENQLFLVQTGNSPVARLCALDWSDPDSESNPEA